MIVRSPDPPPSAPVRFGGRGAPPLSAPLRPTDLRSRLTRPSRTRLNSGHAEPQVAVPALRHEPGAVRRAGAAGRVAPAPAADHPVRGLCGTGRIGRRTLAVVRTYPSRRGP